MKIKLINISKHYSSSRKNKLSVLKKVTLNIYPGDIISVVGKNGSGKTTLLKVISREFYQILVKYFMMTIIPKEIYLL